MVIRTYAATFHCLLKQGRHYCVYETASLTLLLVFLLLLLPWKQSQLLEEQRSILSHLGEERHALAEERAQFTVAQRLKADQEMKESGRLKKVCTVVPAF